LSKLLWTQRGNFGPAPRFASAMAFDSTRGRTVLFGGSGIAGRMSDTWEWDGSFWTQMHDTGPAPRAGGAMAYDVANQASTLFGGTGADDQPLGDTWKWDGADWTKLSESGPPARRSPAMAFDISRKRLVLFGGQTGPVAQLVNLSDTWEFDGADWTQQQDTGPAPRFGHAMAYDGAGRVILFGGADQTQPFGDSWAWDGAVWVQIAEFGPPARFNAPMASGASGQVFLYGGQSALFGATPPFADTWELEANLWTQRQDIGPGPLQSAAMAFDSARTRFVLFGGAIADGSSSGLTWEAALPA
jgi:Kelch motif